jgi:nitroreductase
MDSTRRNFIRIIGSSLVIHAAHTEAVAGSSATAAPGDPYAAWQVQPQSLRDLRLRCLSYAILAPNPHNRQPWWIELRGADRILVYLDRARLLPHTDPYSRQLVIGHGAFLELLSLAASANGLRAEIEPFPEGSFGAQPDERPVAAVRLVPDAAVRIDPLFAQVLHRRTQRGRYDMTRPPSAADLAAVMAAAAAPGQATTLQATTLRAAATLDPDRLQAIRALATEAWDTELTTRRTLMESVDLTRVGRAEIARLPDGISLRGAMFDALGWLGLMSRETMGKVGGTIHQAMLDDGRAAIRDTPAFVWLVSPDGSRAQQIAAGRAYVRCQLAATALGLGMQPVSQALQEYDEVRGPYQAAKRVLDAPGIACVQMLARIGRVAGGTGAPSPRWPLETRLKPSLMTRHTG